MEMRSQPNCSSTLVKPNQARHYPPGYFCRLGQRKLYGPAHLCCKQRFVANPAAWDFPQNTLSEPMRVAPYAGIVDCGFTINDRIEWLCLTSPLLTAPMSLTPLQSCPTEFLRQVRLIATDMDGTLTRCGKFSSALLQSLEQLAAAELPVIIVTGRSAGWVNGVVSYLPVMGAIAENGGIYFGGRAAQQEHGRFLGPISDLQAHRLQLQKMFQQLQQEFPKLEEAGDNRFRLTDWTFAVQGLSTADLHRIRDRCHAHGWGFTYSTVQCHIKPLAQEKATALAQVIQADFAPLPTSQVITVGDSPNDESLFDGDRFPFSIGVANVLHYTQDLTHHPAYVTEQPEVDGFCELVRSLLQARREGLNNQHNHQPCSKHSGMPEQ